MNNVQVSDRVHPVFNVHHIGILECATHVKNAIHCCNVRQKTVAETLSSCGAPAAMNAH